MEGGISSNVDAGDLLEKLFSWSLHDIQDENLYKEKVKMTPDSFASLEHYCVSLVYPLLEKTRAHLCSSMKAVCTAPFADLVKVEPSAGCEELFYDASVGNWRNTESGRGNYKTLPGDILLLTHVNPQIVYNLESLGTSWTFGCVEKISEDKYGGGNGNSSNHFQLKMFNYKVEQKYPFVVFLMNITASRNIWNAMRARKGHTLKVALRLDSMGGVEKKIKVNLQKTLLVSLRIKKEKMKSILLQVSKEFGLDKSVFPRLSILGHSKDLFDAIGDLLDEKSDVFKNATWKVLFSDNFRKSFDKVKSLEVKEKTLRLLLKLSTGWRPKEKGTKNVDIRCQKSSMILRQYNVTSGWNVTCSIDILKGTIYSQVLRVWYIGPLEDNESLVERLDEIFQFYTDDFISRCNRIGLYNERDVDKKGYFEIPVTWKTTHDIVRYKERSDTSSYLEYSNVNDSLLLMKFYPLSPNTVNELLSDLDESELPFQATDEQMDIISCQKSTFILGRSGTGKTNVLTTKLCQREQQHELSKNEDPLKQLLVTVNPGLCSTLRNYVLQLKRYFNGGSHSGLRFADVANELVMPTSFRGIASTSYPLVITFEKLLLMLDATVGRSFFERFTDYYVKLCDELYDSSAELMRFISTHEVKYEKFNSEYWPHFSKDLTKELGASQVFTQIMSHIKGGLQSGEFENGKIDRDTYLILSEARTSSLSETIRGRVFTIYESYEEMKVKKQEFDFADLVNDLHCRLSRAPYEGELMDFVYIDEVQDLTMREIALFKHLCKNTAEGFVFAGDTAQTIARGVDFRFEDIRSLFYREFIVGSRKKGNKRMEEKGQISKVYNLTQNYRTHNGILGLAHSVIELVYHFFPQCVDILKPESSLLLGEFPILVENVGVSTTVQSIFGSKKEDAKHQFGAQQVIIVRDDLSKEEILQHIKAKALVLTIAESKGLEFEDVLLLNFFGSSPLKTQWRVVYEYMCKQKLLEEGDNRSYPRFNETKHNVLCAELKLLYVAVTRSKQRLWISEDDVDVCKPIFEYWKSKSLVLVKKLDDSFTQTIRVSSSPEEWKSNGHKLLEHRNYAMAVRCFQLAGDLVGEKLAKATQLRSEAERLYTSDLKSSENYNRQAAELFDSIGKAKEAADCFYSAKDYERAGKIYLEECGQSALGLAGTSFFLAGSYEKAADVFARAKLFSKCLSTCKKGKLLDMGLQYIRDWKLSELSESDPPLQKLVEEFTKKCALDSAKSVDEASRVKILEKLLPKEEALKPPPSSIAQDLAEAISLTSRIFKTIKKFKKADLSRKAIMLESTRMNIEKIIHLLTGVTHKWTLTEHSSSAITQLLSEMEMLHFMVDLGNKECLVEMMGPFLMEKVEDLLPNVDMWLKTAVSDEKAGDDPDVEEMGQGKAEASQAADT